MSSLFHIHTQSLLAAILSLLTNWNIRLNWVWTNVYVLYRRLKKQPFIHIFPDIKKDNGKYLKSSSDLLPMSVLQPKHWFMILTHFYRSVAKGTPRPCPCSTEAMNKFHPHMQLRAPPFLAQGHKHIQQKSEIYLPTAWKMVHLLLLCTSWLCFIHLNVFTSYAAIPSPIFAQEVVTSGLYLWPIHFFLFFNRGG